MKRLILSVFFVLSAAAALNAQTYTGPRAFDGEHRNEVNGYLIGGTNVVTGTFFGQAVRYTRHLTDRWSISGSEHMQYLKQVYSVDVMGTFRIPIKRRNLYIDGRIIYNRYNQWQTNEFIAHVSALWESRYWDLRWGWSLVQYRYGGMKEEYKDYSSSLYTEPLVMTFGIGVNIRPRESRWNLGLFFRNYDNYYFDNWNINWGVRGYYNINDRFKLYGEFDVRPAGSMSQLATRYEGSQKFGVKYVW